MSDFNVAQTLYFWSDGSGNVKVTTVNSAPTSYPTSAGSANVGKDLRDDVNALYTEVNNSLTGANADIQSIINEIKSLQADVTSYADRTKTFEERVSNFLEREINRVLTKVADDGLTRALEPVLVFQAGDNYNVTRFFEGQVVPAGKVTLVPTTMTYELLAPAFKKYVAIKAADGSFAVQKLMTKGDKDFKKVETTLKAGEYTVIYSALDFYGNQVSKKYNITVK